MTENARLVEQLEYISTMLLSESTRRLSKMQEAAEELERSLESPRDLAIGILMERTECSRDDAMHKLKAMAAVDGGDLDVAAKAVVASVRSRPKDA